MEKDIVLIVGGGGMAGIFSAGVLKVFEDESVYGRIHSVYAASVGACTGARFLVKQSELGGKTFYTKFNNEKFIKGNLTRYFFQVLRYGKNHDKVEEVLDFDYFNEIILESNDKIDIERLLESEIPLYVKVFNNDRKTHQYLPVKPPLAYERIIASASMTPLTLRSVVLGGEVFFDGETVASNLDEEIINKHSDKIIIKINNYDSELISCNVFKIFPVYALLRRLYGAKTAGIYLKNSFNQPTWERCSKKYENVVVATNDIFISPFCKDEEKLREVFRAGIKKGREILKDI